MTDRVSAIRALIDAQPVRWTGLSGLLEQVCRAVLPVLSASGSGISMMTVDGTRGVCVASDPVSQRVDELQFSPGEGPCMDAFHHRRPVLVTDLDAGAARWPMYAPAARQDGVRAVFAFPLQIGAARLGVLDVYRAGTGPMTGGELTDAMLFSDVTVSAILDRHEDGGDHPGLGTDDLAAAVQHRAALFQAQGMVMVQLGIPLGDAMARLRAHAYADNRNLDEVARDVIAGRLRFTVEDEAGRPS